MTKLFNLRSFRVLRMGGAKASTYGELDGNAVEIDDRLYFKP
ncbi:hypothetical protein [Phenylobacterium sp. J426]|nr:hypothetical protein [Phenylobacterium sp. J426]